MVRTLGALVLLLLTAAAGAKEFPTPLEQAHAHNDYRHERPLLDALAHGFCSVEADIYLVGDKLLVAHDREELPEARSLQELYLDPLRARVRANEGQVHGGRKTRFTLLIDIKSDGEETYAALAGVLAGYRDMLTESKDGAVTQRAVTVVISGNRPRQAIADSNPRLAAIDGRLGDLDSELDSALLPLISDRWSSHFKWRGEGEIPAAEREKLRKIVEKSHAAGRRVRFWATPEKRSVWRELRAAGVDHINTDDLAGLRDFLMEEAAAGS